MNVSNARGMLKRVPGVVQASRMANSLSAYCRLIREYMEFRRMISGGHVRLPLRWKDRLLCLHDRTKSTPFDRHYIYHPAWAARILAQTRPAFHVDVSSSLHFVSLVSAFVPVKFYDYRPADLQLAGLSCERADLLALPFPDRSVQSLSCMHVVEHVGLGRYGDPLDPDGDIKAMRELRRVLAPGGSLLFVVPIGKPVIRFNGHRIYSYEQILSCFSELGLQEFTLIPESFCGGPPVKNATKERTDQESYACGCFWFRGKA